MGWKKGEEKDTREKGNDGRKESRGSLVREQDERGKEGEKVIVVQILRARAQSTIKAFESLDLGDCIQLQGLREGVWMQETIKGELKVDVYMSLGLEKWLEDISGGFAGGLLSFF